MGVNVFHRICCKALYVVFPYLSKCVQFYESIFFLKNIIYCYENTCYFLEILDRQNMTHLQLKNTIQVKISVELKITYK